MPQGKIFVDSMDLRLRYINFESLRRPQLRKAYEISHFNFICIGSSGCGVV